MTHGWSFLIAYLLPAATKLGQGSVFTSVCLSTERVGEGEACLPQCMLGYLPRTRHPLGPDTPRSRQPPRTRHPSGPGPSPPGSRLQHTVNERPVRIQLECILVLFHFSTKFGKAQFSIQVS